MLKPSSLASWRTLALIFALINLKSLPLAWHFRLFYRMFTNWSSRARVTALLKEHASSASTNTSSSANNTHPVFQPVSIFSRSPLLETDYNLHKSNSTYFADLDESRTALVTKLLIAGFKQGAKNLERDGHKGRLNVILGSVHTSFHREIKPYELYEVRSRVLGWDQKWLVIASFFIRPATKGRRDEVLLASALSKYVVKKGRFTVSPTRCLTTAGWLPPAPENSNSSPTQAASSTSGTPLPSTLTPLIQLGGTSDTATPDGIAAPIPESAAEVTAAVVEKLESAAAEASSSSAQASLTDPLLPLTKLDKSGAWDWHRIDMERLRGLQIAANWLDLDKDLIEEFKRG
jgi:hypothetical protein